MTGISRLLRACAAAPVLALAALAFDVPAATAQAAAADPSALQFLGFRAGAQLADVAVQMRALGGTPLRCDRAKADRRLQECRGTVRDPQHGGNVRVWLSAIDSTAAILTLSADVAPDQLDRWRSGLEQEYGRVGARVQGPQWMMQWVRDSRMVRLTWRVNREERVASVSLVDGQVLDGWGNNRREARGG